MTKDSTTRQRVIRALKKKKYKRLLKYSGNVKYTPCKELGLYIVKRIAKDLPRLKAEKLIRTIWDRLDKLPLDIKLDAHTCNFVSHPKVLWYKLRIEDKYIHKYLFKYFTMKHYTTYTWSKEPNTIFIRTYN